MNISRNVEKKSSNSMCIINTNTKFHSFAQIIWLSSDKNCV